MKPNTRLILFTAFLVLITTLCKMAFAPILEWSGFSPIMAIALFSGMIVSEKGKSFLLPLLALILSDTVIEILYQTGNFPFHGFYKGQWINYILLLTITAIGWMVQGKNYGRILVGVLSAPTLFFLVSNFMVWAGHGGYHRAYTFTGLIQCYTDGLPFYKNALMATLLFVPGILLSYNYFVKRSLSLKLA